MIVRFANELRRGMVEMTVINELAFPGGIQLGKDISTAAWYRGVRMTDRRCDSPLQTGVARSLKQLLVEAR